MGLRGSHPGKGFKNLILSIGMVNILVLTGMLGFITFETEVVSASNTIYVGTGFGNDSATINGGIGLANDGDTVFVYSGIYYENVIVDKTIILMGEHRDATIIDALGNGDVIQVTADWVNISGFSIINGSSGIKLDSVRNCRVFDNNASDSNDGIVLLTSDYNILANNIGTQNRMPLNGSGFYILFSSDNIIINNTFSYWDDGIHLIQSHDNNIKCSNFSYNRDGIVIGGSSYNNIVNNAMFMNIGDGIIFNDCSYGYNTIIGNTISSNSHGIFIFDSRYDTFIGNTIFSNTNGIYVRYDANYNTFIGNSISLNTYGIYISKSNNNTFTGNTIFSNIYHGIYIEDDGFNRIYHNTFTDNNGGGVQGVDYIGTNYLNDTYPTGGNYWSNWTFPDLLSGPDQDQPGSDGIVDNPYLLDGGSGAIDYYPLTTPPPDVGVPDLEIKNSDIVFDPSSPVGNGTLVSIGATIHNIDLGEAIDVIVRFYNGDPSLPGSYQIGTDKYIPSINGGSSAYVEVQWTANPIGIHNIYVVVDPDETVIEMKECNNVANRKIVVGNVLQEGWNLISIPLIQSETNLSSVLYPIAGSYDAVQWYYVSDTSDQWKHNHILKPSHMNELNIINHTMGFWIHITEPGGVIFEYDGIKPTQNQSIPLHVGWNPVHPPPRRLEPCGLSFPDKPQPNEWIE
jgi:parallel beta-helix repeat protein